MQNVFHYLIADSRFSQVFTKYFRRTDIGFASDYAATMEIEMSTSFLVRSRLECLHICWGNGNCTGAIYAKGTSLCWVLFPKYVVLPWHDFKNVSYDFINGHIDGLVQERRNASALAMELRLPCTNP